MSNKKARVIAFYLPQFHPIPENDAIWGKGFTEWTNVAKARPVFRGHYQPQLPADLGFYDLRLSESREAQAELAREYGVEGFCYWHYWFGNGREILERPFYEVLNSGKPDFPFCLGWANHSWSNKTWQKSSFMTKQVEFIHQEYPGDDDYRLHFYTYLKAFKDKRYITVEGKPLFYIFDPYAIPDCKHFIELWNQLAIENGLKGFYFVARSSSVGKFKLKPHSIIDDEINVRYDDLFNVGFDAVNSSNMRYACIKSRGYFRKLFRTALARTVGNIFPEKYDYKRIIKYLYTDCDKRNNVFPELIPRWDKTPRKGKDAEIFYNTEPEYFGQSIDRALQCLEGRDEEHKILFLFAWNEWGEGAYLEPDLKYGRAHLEVLKSKILY